MIDQLECTNKFLLALLKIHGGLRSGHRGLFINTGSGGLLYVKGYCESSPATVIFYCKFYLQYGLFHTSCFRSRLPCCVANSIYFRGV